MMRGLWSMRLGALLPSGRLTLALGLCAGLLACAPTVLPIKEPNDCKFQEVTVGMISSADMNRAQNGEPRPVQLRIYQLANDVSLHNASFDDVWKKDAEILGADIIKSEELPVYPNTRTELKFERDDAAQYVAAVALFRSPKGRSWYQVFELPPAPSEGACGQQACEGEGCEEAGPPPDPKFFVWIDESRVEDGVEYVDAIPEEQTERVKSQAKAPASPDAPTTPAQGE